MDVRCYSAQNAIVKAVNNYLQSSNSNCHKWTILSVISDRWYSTKENNALWKISHKYNNTTIGMEYTIQDVPEQILFNTDCFIVMGPVPGLDFQEKETNFLGYLSGSEENYCILRELKMGQGVYIKNDRKTFIPFQQILCSDLTIVEADLPVKY